MAHNLSASELLAYCTVRIESRLRTGGTSTGTGFFFGFCQDGDRNVPAIITNKHVIKGADQGTFLIHETDANGAPHATANVTVSLANFDNLWIKHPAPDVDLCVLPVASLVNQGWKQNKKFFYVTLDSTLIPTDEELANLSAIEDVVMVGYPVGIWDSVNNMPVIRRGITATHPAKDYEGLTQFMIDVACFPGSSGSPVFLFNLGSYALKKGGIVMGGRIKLLGALYAGPQFNAKGEIHIEDVPTGQRLVSMSSIPINLGLVVKSKRIHDFEQILRKLVRSGRNA